MEDEPEPAKSKARTWKPLAARAVPYGSHSHRLPSLWWASTTPAVPVPSSTAARLSPAPLVSRMGWPRWAWSGHSAPTGGSVGPGLAVTVVPTEFPGAGGGGAWSAAHAAVAASSAEVTTSAAALARRAMSAPPFVVRVQTNRSRRRRFGRTLTDGAVPVHGDAGQGFACGVRSMGRVEVMSALRPTA